MKSSRQIYLFVTDNPFFCEKVKINCYSIFKCVFQMLSNTSLLFCYSSQTSLFSESSRTSRISWIKGFTIIFEGTRSQNCPKTWEFWEIYLPWNYREISIKWTPGYSGHFYSGTASARYRQIWLQFECKLRNFVKNARIRSFSCQMMEKYWRKNSLYPEIVQAVWNNKNDQENQ